jgi:hypothetical protein
MKVEILHIIDCPTHLAAMALVRDVLANHGFAVDIREILVADERMAKELDFHGSPTVRVNGRDVMEDIERPAATGLCCRLYSGSTRFGLPPVDAIRRAVVEASERDRQ